MARPFPTFGHDQNGRRCLFIGEDHTNNENLVHLCWQMMYLAGQVDGVFIEYYRRSVSPTPGNILTELTTARFAQHRPTMHFEVADLRYQCQRRGILLEGWNAPSTSVLQRVTNSWNNLTAMLLVARANTLGLNSYVVFGGSVHGQLFAQAPVFNGSLPLFMVHQGRFREYQRSTAAGVQWAP